MAATALLIGPRYPDLRGIERDIEVMTETLTARGFAIRRCVGDEATREGILAAYEDLIDSSGAGDPVVVYYSGHGGFVDNRRGLLDWQHLVPTDYERTTGDDFRGITSVELSIRQDRLWRRCGNVTVILDCCHAGFMSRDPRTRVKAAPVVPQEWVTAHLDRLAAAGLQLDRWREEGHPDVVRVVACSPRQKAVEYENDDGVYIGLLTESLAMALREAGDAPVTWADIMDRVRRRVGDLSYDQRPALEGPPNRLLFQTGDADRLMSLPVSETRDGGRLRLMCAPLLAVASGDRFVIMPPGSIGIDAASAVGVLVVDRVDSLWAEGRLALTPGRGPDLTAMTGARAFRSTTAAARIPVRAPADTVRAAAVIAAIRDAPLVRPATPDDSDWLAEVRIEPDGGLVVHDRIGPLHEPRPADDHGVEQVMRDLKILAQAAQLRRLSGSSRWALGARTRVEWGRVVDGEPRPLESGAGLRVGDRIYVQVGNDGPDEIHVSIIDIGLSGRIEVVTGPDGGWPVRPGGVYTFGRNRLTGELTGFAVTWPAGLGRIAARPETLLVFVLSDEQNLRALTQPGIAYRARSPLMSLLEQLRTGGDRDAEPERPDEDVVRYDVHRFDFDVQAAP